MNRADRFLIFLQELEKAASAAAFEEARLLLETVLNSVEDRHSGVPYNQASSNTDGRIYPPHDDFEKRSDLPGARMFRTRGHRVFLAANGAIRIVGLDGKIVLDKAGKDGGRCPV
ncbi:MAG: hypothetical protein V4574_19335 [Pseudomonadota bacterium]